MTELSAHDRLGHLRGDGPSLEERWADPATRVLVVSGGWLRAADGAPSWLTTDEAGQVAPDVEGTRILLGDREGTTYFALHVPGQKGEGWVGMREVGRHFL